MSTIISRHGRKLGVLAAGVALCLGVVTSPSAWADDPAYQHVSVEPSKGWLQAGSDEQIVITGVSTCAGKLMRTILVNNDPKVASEISTDPVTGEWTYSIGAKKGVGTETGGGLLSVAFECKDSDSGVIIWNEQVDIPVTGISAPDGDLPVGEEIIITVDGFQPGETVTVTLSDGEATGASPGLIGSGVADSNGHADITIVIPKGCEFDTYKFTVEGADSARTFVAGLKVFSEGTTEVTPPPTTPTTPEEPDAPAAATGPIIDTGGTAIPAENLPLLGFSVVLLMGAGCALMAGRRVRS